MYVLAVKNERGALVSEHLLETGEVIVGRFAECDIALDSTAVSRQHACFYIEGGRAFVSDMGSANGVYVNEQRINRDMPVDETSRIRVSEFLFQLEIHDPEPTGSGIRTALVAPDNAHGKIVILTGQDAGREVLLYEPIISVGRIDENELSIQDPSVSRQHAQLKRQDDGSYALTDLGSSNGVFAQGRRISRPTRVGHGDRITFGQVECLLTTANSATTGDRSLGQWLFFTGLAILAAILGSAASLLWFD